MSTNNGLAKVGSEAFINFEGVLNFTWNAPNKAVLQTRAFKNATNADSRVAISANFAGFDVEESVFEDFAGVLAFVCKNPGIIDEDAFRQMPSPASQVTITSDDGGFKGVYNYAFYEFAGILDLTWTIPAGSTGDGKCLDTDDGATGFDEFDDISQEIDCDFITRELLFFPSEEPCTSFDDDDFNGTAMCCACGGGKAGPVAIGESAFSESSNAASIISVVVTTSTEGGLFIGPNAFENCDGTLNLTWAEPTVIERRTFKNMVNPASTVSITSTDGKLTNVRDEGFYNFSGVLDFDWKNVRDGAKISARAFAEMTNAASTIDIESSRVSLDGLGLKLVDNSAFLKFPGTLNLEWTNAGDGAEIDEYAFYRVSSEASRITVYSSGGLRLVDDQAFDFFAGTLNFEWKDIERESTIGRRGFGHMFNNKSVIKITDAGGTTKIGERAFVDFAGATLEVTGAFSALQALEESVFATLDEDPAMTIRMTDLTNLVRVEDWIRAETLDAVVVRGTCSPDLTRPADPAPSQSFVLDALDCPANNGGGGA
ncbi:MAG: leucine-rich repeat protein, partial [Limisphaerales bacterium]